MTTKLRTMLVGAGMMGSLHARLLAGSSQTELVRVIDPNETQARAVSERYEAKWAPELDTLDDIDAVVIAAPTEYHLELAHQVLGCGLPLLIEKPVTANLASTEGIVAEAERRDLPLVCGFLERFNPAVLTAVALIDNPVHVTATRHSPYAPRVRTGVAWDLLIHDVDLAITIFGAEPVDVRGKLGQFHPSSAPGAEDIAEAVLGFESGGVASVSASRVGQRKVRTLVVNELDRMIEADLIRRDVTIYKHVSIDTATPDGRGYRQQSIIEIPELSTSREPLATQLDHFLDIVAGRGDAAAERRRILPAHRVVDRVMTESQR